MYPLLITYEFRIIFYLILAASTLDVNYIVNLL
jgi:hypothetical protein